MLRALAALRPLLLPAAAPRLGALRAVSGGAGAPGSGAAASGASGDAGGEDDAPGAPSDAGEAAFGADAGDSERPRVDDEEQGPDGWHHVAKLFDAPASLDIAEYWHNAVLSGATQP